MINHFTKLEDNFKESSLRMLFSILNWLNVWRMSKCPKMQKNIQDILLEIRKLYVVHRFYATPCIIKDDTTMCRQNNWTFSQNQVLLIYCIFLIGIYIRRYIIHKTSKHTHLLWYKSISCTFPSVILKHEVVIFLASTYLNASFNNLHRY